GSTRTLVSSVPNNSRQLSARYAFLTVMNSTHIGLRLQQVDPVDIDRGAVSVHRNRQGEGHGGLCRSNRDDEGNERMASDGTPAFAEARECEQREVARGQTR